MKREFFVLFVLLASCAPAGSALLGPARIDAARLLPPPPTPNSPEAKAEVAELHAIARGATPAMMAAARRDAADERPDLFDNVLGFDVMALPVTSKLLDEVVQEQAADAEAAKAFFDRDRPWIVDPSLETCEFHMPGPARTSYPSGHATLAFSTGVVLAALMPDKAQAILARARDYAENRLVCGMHFRSDIVAGQELGTVVAVRLMQAPAFAGEMKAARAELAARHRLNP